MSSAANAETTFDAGMQQTWMKAEYADPTATAGADLGYLLFFLFISLVAIGRDTFSKTGTKSLKEASWPDTSGIVFFGSFTLVPSG